MFRLRFISFTVLIVTTFSLGCNIIKKEENRLVKKLDPVVLTQDVVKILDLVVLTQDDLPTMQVTSSHTSRGSEVARFTPEISVLTGLDQWWSGDLRIRYWLFDASHTAKNVAATGAHHISAAPMNWQPELNPEDVIGDGTWRRIPWRQREYISTHFVFVKNNVLVHIMTGEPSPNQLHQLQFVRDLARKIVTKIEAVLPKK